ncbi:YdaS family helix-turn-helix protein [Sphingopyxis sp. J-6]|uniref:transcriptional regulator n=1 Tax=Sphingopyxis sp. J-6 TaxID=3122054 RepID=UPI0039845663
MVEPLSRFEALKRCLELAGSQPKLARDLKLAQSTVWRWLNQTKQMPPEHVLDAERLYGVSRHDLRPDIYPREPMIDQQVEDRFYGVDFAAPGRRFA